jgi:tRNA A-37 threonylcarbamoyl transferase component Bud32
MTPITSNSAEPGLDRDARVDRVVARTVARRDAGEHVPDAEVVADHPDLLPELARSLRMVAAVQRAYLAARRAGMASTGDALHVLSDDELDAPLADPVGGDDRIPTATPELDGYEILGELPHGGQALVYLARQTSTGRRVAVKVLTDGRFASARARRRFDREADVLAALDHPHLVSVVDAGQTADGSPFLVMPYVDGLPLDEHLAAPPAAGGLGGADARPVLALFERLARAVHAAHAAGVIHRDLKPSNIRVDRNGEPRVLDFGLARLSDPPEGPAADVRGGASATLTMAHHILGSPAWMSPEQAAGAADAVDGRADVYALGVTLYHALAGRPPYPDAGPPHAVLAHVLGTTPIAPSRSPLARRGVTRRLDAVVLKCLAKHPDDRYPTAAALADDLARCRAGQRPWAAADRALRRAGRSDRLGRSRWAAAVVAAVAVVAWEGVELGLFGASRPVVIPPAHGVALPPVRGGTAPGVGQRSPAIDVDFVRVVAVQAGTFVTADPQTGAPRPVTVAAPFWIGATEVTQAEYAAVMGLPLPPRPLLPLPVTNVTRSEAMAFCRRLGIERHRTCRLPTAAEWEFAARSGRGETACGDLFGSFPSPDDVGWHAGNSAGQLHPAAELERSPFGLYDMNGNAAEWCADRVTTGDGHGVAAGGRPQPGTWGVVMGGSYASPADHCRNRSRELVPIDGARPDVGFRVVFEGLASYPGEK